MHLRVTSRWRTLAALLVATGWITAASSQEPSFRFDEVPPAVAGSAGEALLEVPAPQGDPLVDDLARRLADLEKKWQQRDAADKKAAEAARKKFVVRPFGRIHIDTAVFAQDDDNRATVGDARNGVDIRRARLGAEGEGFDILFYRFDVDFTTFDQSTQTRPVIVDAFIDFQQLPLIGNVRFGHFREPFSLERLDSTHDLPFLERTAVVNTLVPFRNIGVMAFNWNADETHTWALGVFNENTNEFGEDYHDRTGIAVTGRTTCLPWFEEGPSGPRFVQLGANYSYRRLGVTQRRFNQTPEVGLKQGLLRTPNFVDTGVIDIDHYQVAGAEAVTVLGPFSMQAEYIALAGGQNDVDESLFLHGGYVEAMYWLTGEHRNFLRKNGIFGQVVPRDPFTGREVNGGRDFGCGAWEVASRISWLDLNHANIRGGEMTNISLGLNWYYAVRSRVMLDYIHSFLNRGGLESNADIVAMRFTYAF